MRGENDIGRTNRIESLSQLDEVLPQLRAELGKMYARSSSGRAAQAALRSAMSHVGRRAARSGRTARHGGQDSCQSTVDDANHPGVPEGAQERKDW